MAELVDTKKSGRVEVTDFELQDLRHVAQTKAKKGCIDAMFGMFLKSKGVPLVGTLSFPKPDPRFSYTWYRDVEHTKTIITWTNDAGVAER